MVQLHFAPSLTVFFFASLLFSTTSALRPFHRRSDLDDNSSVSEFGYTVPLAGSSICATGQSCMAFLPAPNPSKTLKQLTFGRGTMKYTCGDGDPSERAKYFSESIDLYDVAAILPFLPDEAAFHSLVPQFYAYDYSELQNSTLRCVGKIHTTYGATVITLYDFDTFPVKVNASVIPPDSSAFNADWVQSTTVDGSWEIYRVETYGGAVHSICREQNGTFEVGFAAEYWFFS